MRETKEDQEQHLAETGWKPWTQEMPDGRKVQLQTWECPLGDNMPIRNELNQWEYANTQRRYTLPEAVRIQRLHEATIEWRRQRDMELAKKRGVLTGGPVKAAQAAALAAAAAEAEG